MDIKAAIIATQELQASPGTRLPKEFVFRREHRKRAAAVFHGRGSLEHSILTGFRLDKSEKVMHHQFFDGH
jgi:hypothetical protein